MATHLNEAEQSDTWSRKSYLKDYSKVGPSKSLEAPGAPPAKQKELSFKKDLRKDNEAIGVPF